MAMEVKNETIVIQRNTVKSENEKQSAVFEFVNGKFQKCAFNTEKPIYTVDDWKFLSELGKLIVECDNAYREADAEKTLEKRTQTKGVPAI